MLSLCCWMWGLHYITQIFCCGHSDSVVAVRGLSICKALVVVVHRLHCSVAWGILVPWPEIELASPALQGRFLTSGPPGKSLIHVVVHSCWSVILIARWSSIVSIFHSLSILVLMGLCMASSFCWLQIQLYEHAQIFWGYISVGNI